MRWETKIRKNCGYRVVFRDRTLPGMMLKAGASCEGFILEQSLNKINSGESYYRRTHTGAELGLMMIKNGRRLGFEIKYSEIHKITWSIRIVAEDLKPDRLYLINSGRRKLIPEGGISVARAGQLFQADF